MLSLSTSVFLFVLISTEEDVSKRRAIYEFPGTILPQL